MTVSPRFFLCIHSRLCACKSQMCILCSKKNLFSLPVQNCLFLSALQAPNLVNRVWQHSGLPAVFSVWARFLEGGSGLLSWKDGHSILNKRSYGTLCIICDILSKYKYMYFKYLWNIWEYIHWTEWWEEPTSGLPFSLLHEFFSDYIFGKKSYFEKEKTTENKANKMALWESVSILSNPAASGHLCNRSLFFSFRSLFPSSPYIRVVSLPKVLLSLPPFRAQHLKRPPVVLTLNFSASFTRSSVVRSFTFPVLFFMTPWQSQNYSALDPCVCHTFSLLLIFIYSLICRKHP